MKDRESKKEEVYFGFGEEKLGFVGKFVISTWFSVFFVVGLKFLGNAVFFSFFLFDFVDFGR